MAGKTVKVYNDLRESTGMCDADSFMETVQLSIEHIINFDISDKKQHRMISHRVQSVLG